MKALKVNALISSIKLVWLYRNAENWHAICDSGFISLLVMFFTKTMQNGIVAIVTFFYTDIS